MTGAPIGYYVHHHGEGHGRRAMAIAAHAPDRFTLIGTGVAALSMAFARLELPDDRPCGDAAFTGWDGAAERPDALHYAPFAHDGVRARALAMAGWMARERPALMVIDVSVEAAMLARLCATPTVYVRLAGDRTDAAHLDAFRGARALLAPFHADLDDPETPDWVRAKTRYFPGLSPAASAAEPRRDVVLAAFGRGGGAVDGALIADAARATPGFSWRAMGPVTAPARLPANLNILGWVDDAEREIASAGVVVAAAGDGMLNAVAAAGRPFVCIHEPRPYDEQAAKARRLSAVGAAVVLDGWPDAAAWPRILAESQDLGGARLSRLHDPQGPAKAAAFLQTIAGS